MLTILSALIARKPVPEAEPIDRDPGIVSLVAKLARSARRGMAALRASYQRASEAELFSASTAWPYNHRAR